MKRLTGWITIVSAVAFLSLALGLAVRSLAPQPKPEAEAPAVRPDTYDATGAMLVGWGLSIATN